MKDDELRWEVAEWWDTVGDWHKGHPSEDELLNEADEVVIHAWDADGNDIYWTVHSGGIGWLPEELESVVADGLVGYGLAQ